MAAPWRGEALGKLEVAGSSRARAVARGTVSFSSLASTISTGKGEHPVSVPDQPKGSSVRIVDKPTEFGDKKRNI
jgi:hypothetical protein